MFLRDPARVRALHRAQAEYLTGVWTLGKPYTPKNGKGSVFADRKLGSQPLMHSSPDAAVRVWNLPKLGKLPYHMTLAGMWDELEATLTDVTFLEAKTAAGMAVELEDDFELAAATATSAAAAATAAAGNPGSGEASLERLSLLFELLRDAVALSQSALSFHPGQLRAQLIGRLDGCSEPSVVRLLERARDVAGTALVPPKTLIPRHQCMNRAGQGKIRTRKPQHTWVSSVALSGEGSVLVSGGYDCSLRVWALPGGDAVRVLQGHRHAVRAAGPVYSHYIYFLYLRTSRATTSGCTTLR